MIRILIVDDHDIVRRGLAQIVAESPGMVVAGEATNGEEALELARVQEFDVAIVDIAMPGKGGLDTIKDLKAERPLMKVIVLSMYPEEQYAVRSLRDGASAYLTKANATDELVMAIKAVAAGKRFITPSVAERLASYVEQDSESPPHECLSDREFQVFLLLGAGKALNDIACELSLSAKTISTYRKRILEKMRMDSNATLIRYAIQHKLIR